MFEVVSESWASRAISEPAWPSDLTDDATPYEFSLGFEQGRRDVRLLIEAQGQRATARDQWDAGMALSERLAHHFDASCAQLAALSDLFEPAGSSGLHFGIWHGVTFRPAGEQPEFKAYLNPLVQGREQAFRVVAEALARLGLDNAVEFMASVETECEDRALPVYFCFDMARGAGSRAKVYVAHYQPEIDDVARVLSRCPNLKSSDALDWCRTIVGERTRFTERPLLSCFSFTQRDQRPCGTLHIPARCYAENDQVLLGRILSMMDDLSAELYRAAVRTLITRPLSHSSGFQTYVSLRRVAGTPRMTIYLAPEVYKGRQS